MPEKKSNYMAELDHWIEQTVIEPLFSAWQAGSEVDEHHEQHGEMKTTQLVKGAIRQKVLEIWQQTVAGQSVTIAALIKRNRPGANNTRTSKTLKQPKSS